MKKNVLLLLSLILLLCLSAFFYSCSSNDLPEGFVEEDVTAQAEKVVSLLSSKDYDSVCATFGSEMKKALDAKALEDAIGSQLNNLGTFKKIESKKITVGKNVNIGDYVTVVLVCSYENGNATYTITIDSEGNVCGLYMK